MLSFKQFLKEYLTPEQRSRFTDIKMSDEARRATDHFFGVGNDHVREDVKGLEPDKSEIHQKVERHLGKTITPEEYKNGTTQDKYGRTVKLGKAISDPQLRDEFNRDNTRAGVKKIASHYATIVRGTEVAGQTNSATNPAHPKGHSWGDMSCKNVDTGSNRHYLQHEITHGTVVMRVHDHNDQEIYRATLHPHHNESGDIAYNLESEYGVKHPAFTAHAHDIASRLSGTFTSGVYTKHPAVYNDSGKKTMIHPSASAEDLHNILNKPGVSHFDVRNAFEHRNVNHTHVERVLRDPSFHKEHHNLLEAIGSKAATKNQLDSIFNKDDRYAFNKDEFVNETMQLHALNRIKDSRITPDHIESVMNKHKDGGMWMEAAVSHPSASHDQISRGINHHEENTRFAAVTNPSLSSKHVDDVLDNPESTVSFKKQVLSHPTAVTPNHISRILNEPYSEDQNETIKLSRLKSHVATLPKLNAKHIDHILSNEPDHHVRAAAAHHDNMTPSLVDKALDDSKWIVRGSALKSNAVESRHIDKALTDEAPGVREIAISNENAVEPHHIDTALNDPHPYVRTAALLHPKANVDHIVKGLADSDRDVARNAYRVANSVVHDVKNEADKRKLTKALGWE